MSELPRTRYDRDILRRAVKALRSLANVPDKSGWVHAAAMKALDDVGFRVVHEYHVGLLENGYGGRIDIVAFDRETDEPVAIEIDARRPKQRSLEKLRMFDGWRIVALRGVECDRPDEIDATVAIHVRKATDAQAEWKGHVRTAAAALRARNVH